jgi:Zn-dependent protease with chaperone function
VPVLDAHLVRRGEYAADRFVADCGYGEQLITLLEQLDSTSERSGLRAIGRRHPSLARRCVQIMDRAAVR